MFTKKHVLALERLSKRHKQLRKMKDISVAERTEIEILDRFFRSVEKGPGDLTKRFRDLKVTLEASGIRLVEQGGRDAHL